MSYPKSKTSLKLKARPEMASTYGWIEMFQGPRMSYRIILGVALQVFQQLTGANYFFYYGTYAERTIKRGHGPVQLRDLKGFMRSRAG